MIVSDPVIFPSRAGVTTLMTAACLLFWGRTKAAALWKFRQRRPISRARTGLDPQSDLAAGKLQSLKGEPKGNPGFRRATKLIADRKSPLGRKGNAGLLRTSKEQLNNG